MRRLFLAVGFFALVSFGCATAHPAEVAAEPAPTPPPNEAAADAGTPGACSADSECHDGQLCVRNACIEISKGLAECQMFRVHFAFNAVDFDPDSKGDLLRMGRCLRADQALHVTIEGNADERGTEEYNLQLGSKRASAVEKYLIALGATPLQLKTLSYGENKPVCTEQDEACWAKNRRASVKPEEPKSDAKADAPAEPKPDAKPKSAPKAKKK